MADMKLNLTQGVSFDKSEESEPLCPNCHSKGLAAFYAVNGIPVHSCLLTASQEDALKYPLGDLRLGFCQECGFISNMCFDPSLHNYSVNYEETQGFSDCFNAFAKSLAQKVIDQYDIHQKTILEIGCGKGEFLALMCELGDNQGIGIDPAYVPERNPDTSRSKVEFIQDFYSEKYAHLEADVICCRHTLEHIAPTMEFMQMLRQTIGERTDTLVFFEVPDVMRVLREGAFWDIYYEHCTYFTAGSLARLFRATGFEIDDLYLDYDDQYLIITAYPAEVPTSPRLDIENDMSALTQASEEFSQTCSGRICYWQDTIGKIVSNGQKVVLWGSGSKGVAFLTTLRLRDQIDYVVDINPYKHGKHMAGTGQQIVGPDFLIQYKPDYVIVMNPVYEEEIRNSLMHMGLHPYLMTVLTCN